MAKDTKIYTSGKKTYPDNPSFDRPGYNGNVGSKAKFDAEIQRAYQSKLGRSASEKELEFRRNANVSLGDQLRDIAGSPEAKNRGQGGSSEGGGEEGGGGHGGSAPEIPQVPEYIMKEIEQWVNGNRGLDLNWLNSAVQRGTDQLSDVREDVNKQTVSDMNKRGLGQSGLLTEAYGKINEAFMKDITNLRADLELQRGLVNLNARQFGINAGIQATGVNAGSAIASNQIALGYDQLAQQESQFGRSLAENSRLTELGISSQERLAASQRKADSRNGLLGAVGQVGGQIAGSVVLGKILAGGGIAF